jgi:hypothetical protein
MERIIDEVVAGLLEMCLAGLDRGWFTEEPKWLDARQPPDEKPCRSQAPRWCPLAGGVALAPP